MFYVTILDFASTQLNLRKPKEPRNFDLKLAIEMSLITKWGSGRKSEIGIQFDTILQNI